MNNSTHNGFIIVFFNKLQNLLDLSKCIDFLGPLALRIYLIFPFWQAGTKKLSAIEDTIAWFGNPEWGLGLPFPTLMAWAAALTEAGGAVLLALGLAVRWVSIPLMVTMVVAMVTVHWQHGWLAIAPGTTEAGERLSGFLSWLSNEYPGRYEYITELGRPIILNNGIEFAATYFIMLLVLFFIGGGKYFSADYYINRFFRH